MPWHLSRKLICAIISRSVCVFFIAECQAANIFLRQYHGALGKHKKICHQSSTTATRFPSFAFEAFFVARVLRENITRSGAEVSTAHWVDKFKVEQHYELSKLQP